MTAEKQVRRYMARVEFLTCRETIDSMLAQGFSKKLIHEKLIADGRCSMRYNTFCEFISNAEKSPPADKPAQAVPPPAEKRHAPVQAPRHSGIIRTDPEPMKDPRTIDPKTII